MNQQLIESPDIVATLVELLKTIDAKRVFLVRGTNSFIFCGAADAMRQICAQTGVQVAEFCEFSVNPKDEEAHKGLQQLLEAQPDVIIAIGGGSVMDMAKLIRHYAVEQDCSVPLWAIPTTAGTGAEATHFAVVYKDGVKHSVDYEDILPDVAILYSPFTYGNSKYLTACTGFDALAQAIESYWAKGATQESREYSRRAIALLWRQLPQLINEPLEELRDQVAEGAYWAGRAINISKTTAPHAFSYAFTSHYGYPHGHAVALTFPFCLRLNGNDELYQVLGLTTSNAMQKMEEYIESLGLSLHLKSDVNVSATLQEVNMQRLANNPIEMTPKILFDLETYLESKQKCANRHEYEKDNE